MNPGSRKSLSGFIISRGFTLQKVVNSWMNTISGMTYSSAPFASTLSGLSNGM